MMSNSTNIHFSSKAQDWLTPASIIAPTIALLGEIDLDPCASCDSPKHVPAKLCLTAIDYSLDRAWMGRVYMNPPYGSGIGRWVRKLRDEYRIGHTTAAIALLPARTDTAWWRELAEFPVCFIRGRLRFSGQKNSAPFPSAVIYLGGNTPAFSEAFGDIGIISCRVSNSDLGGRNG
jgi:DNA N-6-adenine-methyltransferase (Dam)